MSYHLLESFSLEYILVEQCTTRKDPESEWLARDNLETNPITIKPETASHEAELFSWIPFPYCSPPTRPFPIKSLALSARVSSQTLHSWVSDKSPLSGPGRVPPSWNNPTKNKWTKCSPESSFTGIRQLAVRNIWFMHHDWAIPTEVLRQPDHKKPLDLSPEY